MADETSDLARITALYALANSDNDAALKELATFRAGLPVQTTYRVRLNAVMAEITMLFAVGRARDADAPLAYMRKLAEQNHDDDSLAVSVIWVAGQLLDEGRPEAALVKLKEAEPIARRATQAISLMRLASSFGLVYTALGNFEEALKHHLEALRLAELQTEPQARVQAQISELNSLSVLYMSMRNPEQALASALKAFALAEANPQSTTNATLASNLINQGFALAQLRRNADSLQAFERALKVARNNKLPAAEATALLNISDFHLRQHAYKVAAEYARLAIAKAEQAGKKMSLGIATANLGFAEAGQGRIKDGAAQVDAAIRIMHDAGTIVDEAGLLGELGQMYVRAGLYREAVDTLVAQRNLDSAIFKSDRARAVAALQESFDAKQRSKQIEVLQSENRLKDVELKYRSLAQFVAIVIAASTLAAVVLMLVLYRRARQANQALAHANSLLEFHSVRDTLTGLLNRRSFLRHMEQRSVGKAGLRSSDCLSNTDCLVILDIDNFKRVNDTWGHAVGDGVLIEVAKRIRSTVRDADMVLRWGGEEFLVFSPNCDPSVRLERLVERLLLAIGETPIVVNKHSLTITISVGFITLPFAGLSEHDCSWEKALHLADQALYHAKHMGRNRAFGLVSLRLPWEQARELLEQSFEQAERAGVVELTQVLGPQQTAQS